MWCDSINEYGRCRRTHKESFYFRTDHQKYLIYLNIYLKHFEVGGAYGERWEISVGIQIGTLMFYFLFSLKFIANIHKAQCVHVIARLHISTVISLRLMVCKENTLRY
jgi:hypothetical protein